MRASDDLLMAAIHSASEELSGKGVRFEVFARLGESVRLSCGASGTLERRSSREFGVGCRVSGGGRAGFGAASGGGARAGRAAARAALGVMLPAGDPIPPRSVLGANGTSLSHDFPDGEKLAAILGDVVARVSGGRHGVTPVQARVLAGTSAAALATGEGFHALATAGGAVMELLVAPPEGPWRHFHFAAQAVLDLDPAAIAERVLETALLATRGRQPERQLADVLLAPPVAAPIVEALVQYLTAASDKNREVRVSGAWHLTDDRLGPEGLLPIPWDGEGLPARRIELIRREKVGERLATWELAHRLGGRPGGAVRPSYRHPPAAGPANLVVHPDPSTTQSNLLGRLANGFYLAVPAGTVRVDAAEGRFGVHAAAVALQDGKPAAAHPLVELRGSFRRLLAGLLAVGADSESFSLGCAVTTPSLLVRRLEIA
ncbi:MAG: metallopeptidase TldD-related protein [Thermoanaerobaculaceae bacterium]